MTICWWRSTLVALAAMLTVASCASTDDETTSNQAETFAEHMHGHLVHVDAIKNGVIAGDLDATREHAVWLSEHDPPPGMPDPWAPYVKEMRQYAAVAAASRDLETVAVAVSEIARTCGECHVANGANPPAFQMDQRPQPGDEDVVSQMRRHLWAADRMWEGLIHPSEEAWNSGADILKEVNLSAELIDADPASEANVDELVQQARGVGEQGGRTGPGPERSVLYGKFLSLCASCHTLTGGGPGTTATTTTALR